MRSLLHRLLNATPVPLSRGERFQLPAPMRNNSKAQMEALGAVGTLFAIVARTTSATARAEWKLFRQTQGEDEERPEVSRHAALDLWRKPNPFTTGFEFREASQQYLDLTGEMPWVVARNARSTIPLELWPVRPDRIAPVPHPRDFITGWVYTAPDGEKVPLEVEDVIFTKLPNPLDPFRGLGPVQSILVDLDSARYSAEWNRNFFLNSAEPGGLIEIPGNLDQGEWDSLQERWRRAHQGVAASHRVATLEGGMKWVDRKYTMRDMQFSELRNVSRDIIREAFGIHKATLGSADDVNRANADAAADLFADWLIVPRLERIRDTLNERYLPMFGSPAVGLEFDFVDPKPPNAEEARADQESRVTLALEMIGAGFDPQPVLEYFDLPDLPYERPQVALPAPAPAEDDGEDEEQPPLNRLRVRNQDDDTDELRYDELDRVAEDWAAATERIVAEWDGVQVTQRSDLLNQIESVVDADDPERMETVRTGFDKGAELLADEMVRMAVRSSQRVVESAQEQGVEIEPGVPGASDLRREAILMRASIREHLIGRARAVAALLADWLSLSARQEALRVWVPDMPGSSVAAAVRTHLDSLSDRFVRDRLGGALWSASNAGRVETLRKAPEASYLASEQLDQNTCDPCAQVDGRRFASLESAEMQYGNGGYQLCEGRDRCRGTVVAVWDTEGE